MHESAKEIKALGLETELLMPEKMAVKLIESVVRESKLLNGAQLLIFGDDERGEVPAMWRVPFDDAGAPDLAPYGTLLPSWVESIGKQWEGYAMMGWGREVDPMGMGWKGMMASCCGAWGFPLRPAPVKALTFTEFLTQYMKALSDLRSHRYPVDCGGRCVMAPELAHFICEGLKERETVDGDCAIKLPLAIGGVPMISSSSVDVIDRGDFLSTTALIQTPEDLIIGVSSRVVVLMGGEKGMSLRFRVSMASEHRGSACIENIIIPKE